MAHRPIHTSWLLVLLACVPLSCADRPSTDEDGYIEIPYPDEVGPTAPFCQWRRAQSGLGEPPPTGPEGTEPHEEKAKFPVLESGSCADIDPEEVDRAIIREAEKACDKPIEGVERGCYRIFDADSNPECAFFAYYFSTCEPISLDE